MVYLQNLFYISTAFLPEAKYFPSGENLSAQTVLVWPLNFRISLPLIISRNIIALSSEPNYKNSPLLLEANYSPSGEKATE